MAGCERAGCERTGRLLLHTHDLEFAGAEGLSHLWRRGKPREGCDAAMKRH